MSFIPTKLVARQTPHALTTPIPAPLRELAAAADFRFNGDNPWDIQVIDPRFYRRVLTQGSLGFGESYVHGWWECERLDTLFHRLLLIDADQRTERWTKLSRLGEIARRALFNLQSRQRALLVGQQHYDIGNDVFALMLDPTMSYSCAYWQNASTLETAQRDKLDMICRKLELQPGERLLDIGCGWGGLAKFAAENYGVEVFGITVSKEQRTLARERCAGLPITIELMEYRDLPKRNGAILPSTFDKIVSVGMFEHVGGKNYAHFFAIVDHLLKTQGLFLLHTIGNYLSTHRLDPWIDRYIFPNGYLPSATTISKAIEGRFLIEDWHNFGTDYDRTLCAWWENFQRGWPVLAEKYSERFYRMWRYYLMSCAGFFRSRQGQLWQLVLSKRARSNVYRSIR